MQLRGLNFAMSIALGAVLAATIAVHPASAQRGKLRAAVQQRRAAAAQRQAEKKAEKQAEKPAANGAVKGQPNVRAMEGLPPKWIGNLQNMPPDEQERFMQNDARFKNLPPARQQQIRSRLQLWNRLTPEQQQAYLQREQVLEQMTPEQRQYVRDTLLPQWQAMPLGRRQAINRHLAILSHMSPETQQAALNDPKFMQDLSPDDQEMLRNLNSLRNPAPPAQ
jgi:Protein of unknown function (DUF3106)